MDGILEKEIQKDVYQILSGKTVSQFPFVSIDQVWNDKEKSEYILENML